MYWGSGVAKDRQVLISQMGEADKPRYRSVCSSETGSEENKNTTTVTGQEEQGSPRCRQESLAEKVIPGLKSKCRWSESVCQRCGDDGSGLLEKEAGCRQGMLGPSTQVQKATVICCYYSVRVLQEGLAKEKTLPKVGPLDTMESEDQAILPASLISSWLLLLMSAYPEAASILHLAQLLQSSSMAEEEPRISRNPSYIPHPTGTTVSYSYMDQAATGVLSSLV